jgi:hypothetical protein
MGSKQPVDPGKHMLHAAAPGFLPADLSVTVAEGQSLPVTLELRPDGDAAQGPAPVAAPASGGAWPVTKTTGVALMGVGGLGVVIGGVLLGVAKSKYDDLSAACPGHAGCAPSLSGELSSYHATGGAAIGSLILGGLALATGIALFVTAPKRASPPTGRFVTPTLGVGHAGLAGAF